MRISFLEIAALELEEAVHFYKRITRPGRAVS